MRFFSFAPFLILFALVSCGASATNSGPAPLPETPLRIVSLDFCADQYALKFAEPGTIAALSVDAGKAFSYMRDYVGDTPQIRGRVEEVLALQPDLIIRAYGGGPGAVAFFEAAGIPVLQIGWANDIAGVMALTETIASQMGETEKGLALSADMQTRIDTLTQRQRNAAPISALYVTPTGVGTGTGTLINELMQLAGLRNYQTRAGWHALPLEQMVTDKPDVIIRSFFDMRNRHQGAWSPVSHTVMQEVSATTPHIDIEGAWTACTGWFMLDAAEAMAAAREHLQAEGGIQ